MSPIAMCTECHEEPLVMTFHWRSKEFVCLKCGRLYDFFGPEAANETPKRLAKMEARKAEWAEHAQHLLTPGSWRSDCETCQARGGGYHDEHATDEERAAHAEALEWLLVRTGRAGVAA